MAYTTINDGSANFQAAIYTGNSSTQSVVNGGNSNLQPDLVWTKCRSNTSNNFLFDSTRGVTKQLHSDTTDLEGTNATGLTAFNTDGWTMGNTGGMNFNNQTYVGWQWKANGGTTASNTDGSITSTVQANTTAGFSIISYTGNGSNGATIGHGLSQTPQLFIPKCLSTATNWEMYYFPTGGTKQYGYLNLTNGFSTWSYTAPTSTTIGLSGSGDSNGNGRTMIGYAFHYVKGYSQIGTYKGNGSGSYGGPLIYTGFKPAFVLTKEISTASDTYQWGIRDNQRSPYVNSMPANKALYPNSTAVENDHGVNGMFFTSNGFKPNTTNAHTNGNNLDYFYAAFASNPFVTSTGQPNTAG